MGCRGRAVSSDATMRGQRVWRCSSLAVIHCPRHVPYERCTAVGWSDHGSPDSQAAASMAHAPPLSSQWAPRSSDHGANGQVARHPRGVTRRPSRTPLHDAPKLLPTPFDRPGQWAQPGESARPGNMWARTSEMISRSRLPPCDLGVNNCHSQSTLTGRFDDHHGGQLARILLDQIDTLSAKIDMLTARTDQLIAQIPGRTHLPAPEGSGHGSAPSDPARVPLPVIERLDEVTGIGLLAAKAIVAEVGLDMAQFPTAGHLVSGAKISPRTIQSGPKSRSGTTGNGNPYLEARSERGGRCCRTDRYLLGPVLPAARQVSRQAQGPRRCGPFDPRHRLAPSRRPDRTLR